MNSKELTEMKNRFDTVLFDFDGTLVDSAPGIALSFNHLREQLGLVPLPLKEMYTYIGLPLRECITRLLGYTDSEQIEEAVEEYRAYYRTEGLKILKPFDGVPEFLKNCKQAGVKTGVVTCKKQELTCEHAELLGLTPYLDVVFGAFPGCIEKTELLRHALSVLQPAPGTVVMVGDRKFDLLAANTMQIPGIGVVYGYGSEEELAACEPVFLANSPEALEHYLLHA